MIGSGLVAETSTGPLYLEIDDRRHRARIYPPGWRMGLPFRWGTRWRDEADLASFISSIGGLPEDEARRVAVEAVRRVKALRRVSWWKRWDSAEAKRLRLFRSF